MFRKTNRLVCAECNEEVPLAAAGTGVLRCGRGHRLQGIRHRSLLLEGAISAVVAMIAGSIVAGITTAALGFTAGFAAAAGNAVAGLLLAAWAVFLLIRGARYRMGPPGASRELAPQYLGSGGGFLLGAICFAVGAYAEWSR